MKPPWQRDRGGDDGADALRPVARAFAHGAADRDRSSRERPALMRLALGRLRRWTRLGLPDIYMLLAIALIRRRRFDDAAAALGNALAEEDGLREDEALDDVLHAAREAAAPDLEVWALLELARRRPSRAAWLIDQARARLAAAGADTAIKIVDQWEDGFAAGGPQPAARYASLLLRARAAFLVGRADAVVARLAEAATLDRKRAPAGAAAVLGPVPPDASPRTHWLRARAFAAAGAHREAADAAGEVVARIEIAEDLELELSALKLQATALMSAGTTDEAARAFLGYGQRLAIATEHGRAAEAFEGATALDPSQPLAWWYLADSRRLASASEPDGERDFNALRQALDAWQTGYAIRPPEIWEAWAYCAYGLILEALAGAADEGDERLWQALRWAEEAVAHDPANAAPHAHAVRRHRWLGHPATALLTARHAVETLDPDELISREYVLTLAELGIGEPIRELRKHERRRAAGGFRGDPAPVEPLWADGIRAFVLLNQGQFAEAARRFGPVIATRPHDAWALAHRALARAADGDMPGAERDAQRVLALPGAAGSGPVDSLLVEHGWCALIAGDEARARGAFEAALGHDRVSPCAAWSGLAAVALVAGDPAAAREAAEHAAAGARHARDLKMGGIGLRIAAALNPEADAGPAEQAFATARAPGATEFTAARALGELEAAGRRASDPDAACAVRYARARILERQGSLAEAAAVYEQLPDERGAALRLTALLERLAEDAVRVGDADGAARTLERLVERGEGSPATVSIAVARAHVRAGRREEARRESAAVVAAARGTEPDLEAADVLRAAGDIYLELGSPADALAAYDAALARTPADAAQVRGELQVRRGIAAVTVGDVAHGVASFREAIETVRRAHGGTAAAAALMDVCADVTRRGPRPPMLDMALRAVAADTRLTPGQRRRLASRRFRALRSPSDPPLGRPAVVIAAHPELLRDGAGDDDLNAMLHETIPDARDRLEAMTGVEIPGVQVAATENLGRRVFRIVLHQVPHGGGHVPPDALLCTDAAGCDRLGLVGASFGNAWDGPGAARWLEGEEAAAAIQAADLPLLGTHDALVWHLEGLLRLLLFRLVGMTEVDQMIERWRLGGDVAERSGLIDAILLDGSSRVRFASLVRRLVREQVPVWDLEALLRAFAACNRAEFDLADAVGRARATLRDVLPGVHDPRRIVTVPSTVAAAVVAAVETHGVLDRDQASALLGPVGAALIGTPPSRIALLVEDPATRAAVQGAAESLARSAAVLATGELPASHVTRAELVAA